MSILDRKLIHFCSTTGDCCVTCWKYFFRKHLPGLWIPAINVTSFDLNPQRRNETNNIHYSQLQIVVRSNEILKYFTRLTHHIAKGKPGTIEITHGGPVTGISKGKNGHLMVVSLDFKIKIKLE